MTDADLGEQLVPGEHVLWEGRPASFWYQLRPLDLLLVLFFFIWVAGFGAVLFSTTTTPGRNAPPPWFFFFPMLFFAVFFFLPRILVVLRETGSTRYVVTDRRILIHARRRDTEVELRNLAFLEHHRGFLSGSTVYFAPRSPFESAPLGWGWMGAASETPAFRGLRNGAEVYRTVSRARAELRGQ